jgi:hypothetical protein
MTLHLSMNHLWFDFGILIINHLISIWTRHLPEVSRFDSQSIGQVSLNSCAIHKPDEDLRTKSLEKCRFCPTQFCQQFLVLQEIRQ